MDKTELVNKVASLFKMSGHSVQTSVQVNHREIDVIATELQGLVRKTILIECTEEKAVGVAKLEGDLVKLNSARVHFGSRAVVMHIAENRYTKTALGSALSSGTDIFTYEELQSRLINFDSYIESLSLDPLRNVILKEYQPTALHFESSPSHKQAAQVFLQHWLVSDSRWLTILGDYGVGKSWMLKRFLFNMMDEYKKGPNNKPLPFFIPLQRFTKAFDFDNLILATLASYGLSGVHIQAFKYLAEEGRVIFLYDSFDEMAQMLSRAVIRTNFTELVHGITGSRAIMTSRPTYFENKSERIVVVEGIENAKFHTLDALELQRHTTIAKRIQEEISTHQFARLNDLSLSQRKRLFSIVLSSKPAALQELEKLFARFQGLENITQRAVIARLLTSVAETLATAATTKTPDGFLLLPTDIENINQAKVFEIEVNNLLQRDSGIGELSAADRLTFLRTLAIYLQQPAGTFFASPSEIKNIVESIFNRKLKTTDLPQQQLESYYQSCRRHSGLTTEKQFQDTSGQIDVPIDEGDVDSAIGFLHNSLREYLVADALIAYTLGSDNYDNIDRVVVTDAIAEFYIGIPEYRDGILRKLASIYHNHPNSRLKEIAFRILHKFIIKDTSNISALGNPPVIADVDISELSFVGLTCASAKITGCISEDTDFRQTDLRNAIFDNTDIHGAKFDGANLKNADFRNANIESIFVYDEYDTETTAILHKRDARQWLLSNDALVSPVTDLNSLLGKKWYEAAREVCKTLLKSAAATRKSEGLWKGTDTKYRDMAKEFAEYMLKKGVLEKVTKSKRGGGFVVALTSGGSGMLTEFVEKGVISNVLSDFFKKYDK